MVQLYRNPDYPYVYETHLHTSEGSACAGCSGEQMAQACYEAGYTGIFVTDHFVHGNTAVDRNLPWTEWVEKFCLGYEHAKARGDKLGLQVFFGWEACYQGMEFLIMGLSKQWLLEHPEIRDCSIPRQYELVKRDGGMVIQCHPFREEWYIPELKTFPEYSDAVEGVNASHTGYRSCSHNNPEFDVRAQAYARAYDKPMTGGSDVHSTELLLGGMAFPEKLRDPQDFIRAVMERKPYLLLTGNEGREQQSTGGPLRRP